MSLGAGAGVDLGGDGAREDHVTLGHTVCGDGAGRIEHCLGGEALALGVVGARAIGLDVKGDQLHGLESMRWDMRSRQRSSTS